ncbi:MAG: hypothetical protein OXC46_05850 [Thaumarchaeota archaeon]|nr:hypothetical protein [Nitrososphaerota archaeon]
MMYQYSKYWLYEKPHDDAETCNRYINEMLQRNPKYQVSIFLLVSKKDIIGVLKKMNTEKFIIKFGVKNETDSIFSIKIAKKDSDDFGNVLIMSTSKSEIYFAITTESHIFVESVLRPFINSFYPEISRAFLSSQEIQQILEMLENKSNLKIITDKITAYKRISHKIGFNKKRQTGTSIDSKESAVTYTGKPYKESFGDAISNDQWIDKIQFHLLRNDHKSMQCYFSRSSLFRFRYGFSPFYQIVTPYIIELVEKKFKLYSNRSRTEDKTRPAPLVIALDHDMFEDMEQNSRFIQSMKKMTHVSTSTYHSNSYIHISLVDYLDGSSFDIWVLSANKITIVPQLRASHSSVARLLNHIFERFSEGKILEYEGYVKSAKMKSKE